MTQNLNTPMRTDAGSTEEPSFDPTVDPNAAANAEQLVEQVNRGGTFGEPEPQPPHVPVPNIDALTVELCCGLEHPTEGRIRDAEVRELNGEDEEYFSRAKTMDERLAKLVERGTARLGNVDNPDLRMINALPLGDRDALMVGIRRATYGDELELELSCNTCNEEQTVGVDLATEIKYDTSVSDVLEVKLVKGGTAVLRWPTGDDEVAVREFGKRNEQASPAEANTVLLGRILQSVDGESAVGEVTARNLNMADRRKIVAQVAEEAPGPRLGDIMHTCVGCGEEWPLPITFGQMFR